MSSLHWHHKCSGLCTPGYSVGGDSGSSSSSGSSVGGGDGISGRGLAAFVLFAAMGVGLWKGCASLKRAELIENPPIYKLEDRPEYADKSFLEKLGLDWSSKTKKLAEEGKLLIRVPIFVRYNADLDQYTYSYFEKGGGFSPIEPDHEFRTSCPKEAFRAFEKGESFMCYEVMQVSMTSDPADYKLDPPARYFGRLSYSMKGYDFPDGD